MSSSSGCGEYVNLIHGHHQVERRVNKCVDQTVAQLVEALIEELVPTSLLDTVEKQTEELDSIYTQLRDMNGAER